MEASENRPFLSIVSPVYLAEGIVDTLVEQIQEVVTTITEDYEIILVEDGSPDGSWEKIEAQCRRDQRVKGIKLSRNFGQHYALSAALSESSGEFVIVMDCDLQDDPAHIPDLLASAQAGYDIVFTIKRKREFGLVKNLLARCYHTVFNCLIGEESLRSNEQIGAYSILSRRVVDAFNQYNDYHRAYLQILRWLGFRSTYLTIDHKPRFSGVSSYSFSKSISLAVNSIIAHTDKLLRIWIYIGFVFVGIGTASVIYIVVQALKSGFQPGWASTTVLIIFSTGLIMTSLGILGAYISKIFEQTKRRPLYVIEERLNP